MNGREKIRSATRMAFLCIAAMMLAFMLVVLFMLLPMGMNGMQQLWAVRLSLYALLVFAFLGGAASIRVAWLRKKVGR